MKQPGTKCDRRTSFVNLCLHLKGLSNGMDTVIFYEILCAISRSKRSVGQVWKLRFEQFFVRFVYLYVNLKVKLNSGIIVSSQDFY